MCIRNVTGSHRTQPGGRGVLRKTPCANHHLMRVAQILRNEQAIEPDGTAAKDPVQGVQPIEIWTLQSLDRLQGRPRLDQLHQLHADRALVFAEHRLPALPLIAQQTETTGVSQLELYWSRQRLHDLRTLVPELGVFLRNAIQY